MWKISIRNLVYKLKFQMRYLLGQYKNIIFCMLTILGIFLTIAEIQNVLFELTCLYEILHEFNWIFLGISFIISIYTNRFVFNREYALINSDIKLNLSVMDVLNNKSAVVIPTNSTFDTKMEDEFISINSIQGQFQEKYFKNNLGALDRLIDEGLQEKRCLILDRVSSKEKQYPIGTVSKITYSNQHFYFVAVADINEYGKPVKTKFQNVQMALEGIWSELEFRGHIEDIAVPLIGTGKAGIQDVTREKVIKEIVFSFIASAKERKVTECLNICIHPSDLESNSLKLEELIGYFEYMCKYKYEESSNHNIGTPIS